MLDAVMGVIITLHDTGFWKDNTFKDYAAPIVRRAADGGREGLLASYGMVPQDRIPKGVKKYDTMNARSETLAERRSFSRAWKQQQLCLVPAISFDEPCYETGKSEWWSIAMADKAMFAVAGLWREWDGAAGPQTSFTQLTINADGHPLMQRFHKPGEEKRSLVIVPRSEWDDWLNCRNPDFARTFFRHYPPELMTAWPSPRATREKKTKTEPALTAPPAANLDFGF
ncbi:MULTISPECIES: SOS response-associated peptidase [unclassified Duganella]|uniref:SOS response-associated peptidase n=1 Tax=unclassified Duganella TaxID=2636909 RepID=UPI001E4C64F7|nr:MULTISPECIES: SOS response-associated peptidase family protein [unclassified Duganella]